MGQVGRMQPKTELVEFAAAFGESDPSGFESGLFGEIARTYLESSPETRDIALEALSDLAGIVGDCPEENAGGDWAYLCSQMKNDLLFRPLKALEELAQTLSALRHRNNARTFIIANGEDMAEIKPMLADLLNDLETAGEPERQAYSKRPVIIERMRSRYDDLDRPAYVGLVNTNTRNGVFIYNHPCAGLSDSDEEKLLDFLAVKLYGGGGAHSMFMKTWSAGLAYSNGLRSSEIDGRINYYAERCPDLSVTMKFVVDQLKRAPYKPDLAEYAVAQAFLYNRGPNSYEARGEAMANNLADGITPDKVAAFRSRILELRAKEDLYDTLHERMNDIYGKVLIGLGDPLTEFPEGNYFIIGPESQFEKMEDYIALEENPQTIYRIYPRDYWITN